MSDFNIIIVDNNPLKLLCDPYETPEPHELKQIRGNVGRAGIHFLVPPKNPMPRKPDSEAWQVISPSNFDGKPEDHYTHTTVHPHFTEYNLPRHHGVRGGQDSRVSLLEIVLSVHDKGHWVGDIDVSSAVRNRAVGKLVLPQECTDESGMTPAKDMISIESWGEILEPPIGCLVIRANGNWIARLAATAVLVQTMVANGHTDDEEGDIVVLLRSVCLRCIDPIVEPSGMMYSPTLRS